MVRVLSAMIAMSAILAVRRGARRVQDTRTGLVATQGEVGVAELMLE